MERLLTVTEVARKMGVNDQRVYLLVRQGKIPYVVLRKGSVKRTLRFAQELLPAEIRSVGVGA